MPSTSPMELMMDALKTKIWSSAFHTSLGGRVAVERLEADVAMPCAVFSIGRLDIQRYMGGQERYEAIAEFTIFDSTKNATDNLHLYAAQLASALLSGTYTISTLDRLTVTRLQGGAPSFEDECWSINERYKLVSFKT